MIFSRKQDEELFWQMAFGDERSINLANFTIHIRQISSQQNVGEIDLWSFNYMKNYLI
jgi:hypothetical protein